MAGAFHFIPGKTFHLSEFHVSDLFAIQTDNYNVSSDIKILLIFNVSVILLCSET